ncbi:PilZ domain-containing protein [Colwellia sp. D2M02]|uniref:PilZ domain-containing protein n=1 Tax=Colwellia sp. D2M02 TaxID=2841562 RepID=UPI001C09878A|nr:PilZ domain-containing protein [Colwellia sp. D2M02]MBU2894237.1 PilZ domain-containing protein [Colwellia sp. D2M02]
MNKDFSKHQSLIDAFRGLANKANFDTKFAAAAGHIPKTEKFLLKMELKRLGSPCTRGIDLRGLVDGECQLFDYQGQSHFLDDIAIRVFEEHAEIYGGYTFGVYEAVKNTENNFRNIYQAEQWSADNALAQTQVPSPTNVIDKTQYPASLYYFDNYPNRAEERMNFAIAIEITLNNKRVIEATSVDISVTGLKIKLINQAPMSNGDVVNVFFIGFEQDFQFTKDSVFSYQVQNVFHDKAMQLVGLKRIDEDENSFSRFLQGYIQGHKRRYKVNLDNTINALQARIFEQFTLLKINELPVFMTKDNKSFLPRYALTTVNNQDCYHYWRDEKKNSTLNFLITEERFSRMQTAQEQGRNLLVFSFVHIHQGAKFFYSMDDQQRMSDEDFFVKFVAFAASKASFAITALSYREVTSNQGYSPYTTANIETKQQSYLNLPLTPEVEEKIAQLPLVVSALDLTSEARVDEYKQLSYEGIDLAKLKLFGHKRLTSAITVDEIAINYGKQRQELRFKYKTPAIIECQSVKWSGVSADFSMSGLKIELDAPAMLSAGDIVSLSFPDLQKITSAFDLNALPYKVVRINKEKTTVNLRVLVKEHQHIGRSFFKLLIEKNKHKLTPDEYAMLTPGLSSALRTLYAVNLSIPCAMVQTSGSRYKVEALVLGKYAHQNAPKSEQNLLSSMLELSDQANRYNLYPLLSNLQIMNLLDQKLKKILPGDKSVNELAYITINPNVEQVDKAVSVRLASEFETPELKRFFIKKALMRGQFYALEVRLSRSMEPQIEHLHAELSYISAYAIHRGKQLEQEIFSVAGLVQLCDMTQETLLRNQLLAIA